MCPHLRQSMKCPGCGFMCAFERLVASMDRSRRRYCYWQPAASNVNCQFIGCRATVHDMHKEIKAIFVNLNLSIPNECMLIRNKNRFLPQIFIKAWLSVFLCCCFLSHFTENESHAQRNAHFQFYRSMCTNSWPQTIYFQRLKRNSKQNPHRNVHCCCDK